MKYVGRVQGTLKKGCDVTLSPRTLIVGKNDSGKSTIIQTMQLAACGFVGDVEERDIVNAHTTIARMFPVDGPWEAKIELVEDDPQQVSAADTMMFEWSLEKNGAKGFKKPKPAAMALAFPVQQVLEKMHGSPESFRAWLESLVCPPLTMETLGELLPPAAREAGVALAKRHRITDLLALGKQATTEATALKSQAETKVATLTGMMAGVPTPLTDEARAILVEEQKTLVAEVSAFAGAMEGISSEAFAVKRTELEAMPITYNTLKAALAEVADVVDPGSEALAFHKRLTVLTEIGRVHAEVFGTDACMLCGQGNAAHLASQMTQVQTLLVGVSASQVKWRAKQDLISKMQALEVDYHKLAEHLATVKIATPLADVETKRARIYELQRILSSDDAARVSWRNHEAIQLDVDQLLARSDELVRVSKAYKRAGVKYLEDTRSSFEDQVTAFLPDRVTCQVDLDIGRIGFSFDGGPLITTLAGARGMQLLFAVAAFVASRGSTPSVLINPDRGWSGDTLEATMTALLPSPCQVVLTSTVEPDHPVEGWTVIRLVKSQD